MCEIRRYQKTSLLEKTPPGAHINKTYAAARGAPAAPGRGCCNFLRMGFLCFLSVFSGEAATLENQWFSIVSTHRKRSGGRLAAVSWRAGCALGALWRRSGGVLGRARPCQPPELAFRPGPLALRLPLSLPPGCRCGDLAPRRPAGPASSQAVRRESLSGKTKSYTLQLLEIILCEKLAIPSAQVILQLPAAQTTGVSM